MLQLFITHVSACHVIRDRRYPNATFLKSLHHMELIYTSMRMNEVASGIGRLIFCV